MESNHTLGQSLSGTQFTPTSGHSLKGSGDFKHPSLTLNATNFRWVSSCCYGKGLVTAKPIGEHRFHEMHRLFEEMRSIDWRSKKDCLKYWKRIDWSKEKALIEDVTYWCAKLSKDNPFYNKLSSLITLMTVSQVVLGWLIQVPTTNSKEEKKQKNSCIIWLDEQYTTVDKYSLIKIINLLWSIHQVNLHQYRHNYESLQHQKKSWKDKQSSQHVHICHLIGQIVYFTLIGHTSHIVYFTVFYHSIGQTYIAQSWPIIAY